MAAVRGMDESELRKRITQIHLDPNLTDQEKAKKRQELLSGQWAKPAATNEPEESTGMIDYMKPCVRDALLRISVYYFCFVKHSGRMPHRTAASSHRTPLYIEIQTPSAV